MDFVIAAAQSKAEAGDIARNIQHHLSFSRIAADLGARLIVFPELSLTGYELTLARSKAIALDSPVLDPLRQMATDTGMTIVAGAPVPDGADGLLLAALILSPDGSVGAYSKQHVHVSEAAVFREGAGGAPLRIGDSWVSLAICRDAAYPEHAETAAAQGANVYAVGAMIDQADYHRKASLMQGYATRHGMAVLLANYAGASGGLVSAGRSCVWDPAGRAVVETSDNDEALLVARCSGGQWTGSVERVG